MARQSLLAKRAVALMERDQAVDIATHFAKTFNSIPAAATLSRDGRWGLRLELTPDLEAWAFTDETARVLWRNVALLERVRDAARPRAPEQLPLNQGGDAR